MNTDSSTADTDKVIARIHKLLSRTKDGSGTTEAEADTALKMAQELAMRHNLDIAQIEAAGASKEGSPVERVKEEFSGRAMYKWQVQLAKYVAEANFCHHMVRESRIWDMNKYKYNTKKSHMFIGRKGNVTTAQLMYEYLTQTIEDLVPIENNAQRLSRSAMSWKEGCGDRLCERLAQRRKDLIEQHDARVKQEEADRQAERRRQADEVRARQTRVIAANPVTETKAQFDAAASDAYDARHPDFGPDEPERPESDDDAWVPEGDEVAEVETGTALVLASQFDESEREANYELAHGLEPGYFARQRARRAQWEAEQASREAEEQVEEVEQPVKAETERQRKARERREAEAYRKNRARWAREDAAAARRAAAEFAKRDHAMYRAGAEAGKSIGLDSQLKAGKDTKKLS